MPLPYENSTSGEKALGGHAHNFIDMTGMTFGKWSVVRHVGGRKWECQCSCGRVSAVGGAALRSGRSTRCKSCANLGRAFKHGQASEKLGFTKKYRTWVSMLQRVRDKKSPRARWYKDVTVCKEWESFEAFDRDVPEAPSEKHTLDRRDNSLGYEPGNVRWATMKEQANNRRNSKHAQAAKMLPAPKE